MHWDGRAGEESLDVAELASEPHRTLPRWLRNAGIAVGCLAIGVLLYLRFTAADVTLTVKPPRVVDDHTVELDIAFANTTSDLVHVAVAKATPAGLRLEGVRQASTMRPATATFPIQPHDHTTLSLTWHVHDCPQLLAVADQEAQVEFRVDRLVGPHDVVSASRGRWRDYLPTVCRTTPTTGVPRLVDRDISQQWNQVYVRLTVANLGGRPLRLRSAAPAGGWMTQRPADDKTPAAQEIPAGEERTLVLVFEAYDCAAPVDGPAMLTLTFDPTTSPAHRSLDVRLADSWANVLGVCTSSP